MKVSVIIPAYNEEQYIERTLKSVNNQSYGDYETIVVCNGCTDRTEKAAKRHADKVFSIKQRGASRARNFGIKKAKGDILVFLDADTQLTRHALRGIAKELKKEENIVGTCRNFPENDKFLTKLFMTVKNRLLWLNWSSGIIFCRKELYRKMGCFNDSLMRHETRDFIRRAKKHGRFCIANEPVMTSMRRYERIGYWNVVLFWIKDIFSSEKGYEAIR